MTDSARPTSGICPNCGVPATGVHCASCGRVWHTTVPDLKSLVAEIVVEATGLERRVLRSVSLLLFRPGKLAVDYADGLGATQVSPTRLYLVVVAVYFVWSVLLSPGHPFTAGWATFSGEFSTWVPRIVFVLVPCLAMLLKAAFPATGYVAHVLLSLHVSAFIFLSNIVVGTLQLLSADVPLLRGSLPLSIWLTWYLYVALRRVERATALRSIAATVAILVGYSIVQMALIAGLAFALGESLGVGIGRTEP